MFSLEKREKLILLVLLVLLTIGIILRFYQKLSVHVDVKYDNFVHFAEDSSAEDLLAEASRININEANVADLMKLKGVGKVLADRIIEYRSANGRFIFIEDLKKVKGLGGKLYDKIKDKVSID